MTAYSDFQRRLIDRHPAIRIQGEPSIGKANSARFLIDGFKAQISNVKRRAAIEDAVNADAPWALLSKILLPGRSDSELFIAMVFEDDDLAAVVERLKEIEAEDEKKRTNNTRFELHRTGCYIHVAPEREIVDPRTHAAEYGLPVQVSEILYADVDRSGRLTPAEVDVVQRLKANYSDASRILRLEAGGSTVEACTRPEDLTLDVLMARVDSLHGYYDRDVLESFHLNLTHNPGKHFVILRGISGTGKSRLAKSYAYAVLGADSLSQSHQRYVSVPVEPQWTDPTFLVGYEDSLAPSGYRRTPFLEALLLADADPLQPVFVLLDEMNRAQVEHYFSNFLSAMESEGPIYLHSGDTITNSGVPPEVPWPSNLYLIGTVNDDESVVPFSPMVLDRANSQDLSDVDVMAFGKWLRDQEADLAQVLTDEVLTLLHDVAETMKPFALNFGNRTVREIGLYLKACARIGGSVNGLDRQIDQKILPKLRGGEETSAMLDSLVSLLASYPASSERLKLMKQDLELYDFFKYR